MSARPEVLAVIGARGGSKGVPNKNLRAVGGRSLVARAIDVARASRSVTRVVVSTDSEAIADEARAAGADVPFLRPAELASDTASGSAPVVHAVEWLAEHEGYRPDLVVLLQPTSPLRASEDIDNAIAKLHLARARDPQVPAVVSVTAVAKHPAWCVTLDARGAMTPFLGADAVKETRQALPAVYALNGAVYVVTRAALLAHQSVNPPGAVAYVMPAERSLDVDSELDLRIVDLLLSHDALPLRDARGEDG